MGQKDISEKVLVDYNDVIEVAWLTDEQLHFLKVILVL